MIFINVFLITLTFENIGNYLVHGQLVEFADVIFTDEGIMTPPEMMEFNGYDSAKYSVVTEDGYILEMHRNMGLKNRTWMDRLKRRPVVFMMHGLASSSAEWLLMGKEKSLGYLLSNAGYDVWFGNSRGNRYNVNHKTLSPNSKEFWSFSWHEIGYYDLPAMIDFVLKETYQEKLQYIGYSQGGTVFYVMGSSRPEYNKKLSLVQLLGPSAYTSTHEGYKYSAPLVFGAEMITGLIGVNLFPAFAIPQHFAVEQLIRTRNIPLLKMGRDAITWLSGSGVEMKTVPTMLGHWPAGGSLRQIYHYGQLVGTGKFRRYDFGTSRNMEYYGQALPTDYDLTKITAPMILIAGSSDPAAQSALILKVAQQLPNLVEYREIPGFTHFDFLIKIDIVRELQIDVIANADKHKTCSFCFF